MGEISIIGVDIAKHVFQVQRSQFGRRAEQLDDDQLQFGFEDREADLARVEAKLLSAAGKTSRAKSPADHPRLVATKSVIRQPLPTVLLGNRTRN